MNRVTIYFNECNPAPPKGYKVYWRAGGGPLSLLGTFYNSPISFLDDSPPETEYDGIIRSIYHNVTCDNVHWSSSGGPGGGGSGSGSGEIGDAMDVGLSIAEDATLCSITLGVYVSPGTTTLSPGVIIYQDAALTNPVTGYLYIQQTGFGVIYNLDISTGEVLSATGNAC